MNSTDMKLELLSLDIKDFKESVQDLADKTENVEDLSRVVTALEEGIDHLTSELASLKKSIDTLCKIMIDQNQKGANNE